METPLNTDFDIRDHEGGPHVINNEEDQHPQDALIEFLRWHHHLRHCPNRKIVWLAKKGLLPKVLATCRQPKCTSCMLGKATKRPWKTRQKHNSNKIKTATEPGECVSINMLISVMPELIRQL